MSKSLYQKYRSNIFAQIIGQDKIVQTLRNALLFNQVGHAYLFAGQRGTGKTSVARILARSVNCLNLVKDEKSNIAEPCLKCDFCKSFSNNQIMDVIEIDAASNRGIDEIRDLREKIKFAPTSSKYKVYIIDEVHMLTKEAFNALLKTLEEPPPHVIFILATTEAHKLPSTILSRVQRFDFRRVSIADIVKNLEIITKEEKIDISKDALILIASKAEGSHRDAISLLEQIKSYSSKISVKEVEEVLGLANQELCFKLLLDLLNGERREVLTQVENYSSAGFDLSQLALGLANSLRQVIYYKTGAKELITIGTDYNDYLQKLSNIEMTGIVSAIEELLRAEKDIKIADMPSLPLLLATSNILEFWKNDQDSKPEGEKSLKNSEETKIEKSSEPITEKSSEKIVTEKDKSPAPVEEYAKIDDVNFWPKVLEESKKHNHSLHALLRDIKPIGTNNDQLLLCAKFKFHLDKISEIKNKRLIEEIIENVTGKKFIISGQTVDKLPPKNKTVDESEMMQTAEEVFG